MLDRMRRRLRAWLSAGRGNDSSPGGLEALFAAPVENTCPIPEPGSQTCLPDPLVSVSSLDPVAVGRQPVGGDAIKDVVRWLEASGWYGEERGALQCYAVWLLRRRAAYEAPTEVPS